MARLGYAVSRWYVMAIQVQLVTELCLDTALWVQLVRSKSKMKNSNLLYRCLRVAHMTGWMRSLICMGKSTQSVEQNTATNRSCQTRSGVAVFQFDSGILDFGWHYLQQPIRATSISVSSQIVVPVHLYHQCYFCRRPATKLSSRSSFAPA